MWAAAGRMRGGVGLKGAVARVYVVVYTSNYPHAVRTRISRGATASGRGLSSRLLGN
ncbi:hypothetical protein [Haladaptatus sp. R4]|uniref:hypothetical protein n=1 Tax=Haladaptatus sp. R4 TaxID=1679489 RepID=UPI0016806EE2|nr:hypothetical protein [Haladaptatus sp. R4]